MTLLSRVCKWIGDRTGTLIVVPHPIAVGNCAEEIQFGFIKARREGKKLVLLHQYNLPWPMHYRLTNHDLIDVDSEYRAFSRDSYWHVLGSVLITVYAGFCRLIHPWLRRIGHPLSGDSYYPQVGYRTLWQPEEIMPGFSWDIVSEYNWPAELHKKAAVHLAPQKIRAAERERERMGLPKNAWFACLHVRESGWHKDNMSERNANIANYIPAIQEVTARGGWVVRLGDSTMTRLPLMERVIDYPFTPSKSYAMDLYLIRECRVYIGMPSGIYDVAMLFQCPMVLTNMSNWVHPMPLGKCDVGVLKHIYSKSRQRFLSVREWMDEPFNANSFSALGEDYEMHENTPDELKAAVSEFFEREAGDVSYSPLQNDFNFYRLKKGREILGKPIRFDDKNLDLMNRYRLASRLDASIGVICHKYLENNWTARSSLNA